MKGWSQEFEKDKSKRLTYIV